MEESSEEVFVSDVMFMMDSSDLSMSESMGSGSSGSGDAGAGGWDTEDVIGNRGLMKA